MALVAGVEELDDTGTLDQGFFEGVPVSKFPPFMVIPQLWNVGIMGDEKVRQADFTKVFSQCCHWWIVGAVKDESV
jgi:hypothetical protein